MMRCARLPLAIVELTHEPEALVRTLPALVANQMTLPVFCAVATSTAVVDSNFEKLSYLRLIVSLSSELSERRPPQSLRIKSGFDECGMPSRCPISCNAN